MANDKGKDSLSALSPRQLAKLIGVVLTERPETSQLTVQEVVEMGRQPYTGFGADSPRKTNGWRKKPCGMWASMG